MCTAILFYVLVEFFFNLLVQLLLFVCHFHLLIYIHVVQVMFDSEMSSNSMVCANRLGVWLNV